MKNIFVIQKHDAQNLHYDFRLRIGKVLKSWAVPKGLPTKLNDKRLAIQTEDHSIEYADFQGTIDKGEYGAGTVEIYDKGEYINKTYDDNDNLISLGTSYKKGRIVIEVQGNKFKGNYALIQAKLNDDPKNWLIMKIR